MKKNGLTALVTGGAGFIGSHLVDRLLEDDWQVTVIDNLSSGHLSNLAHAADRIRFLEGDIRDAAALAGAMAGCDVVFHQAAVVSVPKTVEDPVGSASVNDLGTLAVLDTAKRQGAHRVVLASSSAVYGDDPTLPKHEQLAPRPLSPYAVQKLTGELNARLYTELFGMETVCLRYFNVYGPRQDPASVYSGVISIFMARAVAKRAPTIYGDGEQFRDFVFVRDVVEANLSAAVTAGVGGGVYNVGTGRRVTVNGLWEMVQTLSGSRLAAAHVRSRAGDIRESLADISLAARQLGYAPAWDFEQGLKQTFDWYLNHGKQSE